MFIVTLECGDLGPEDVPDLIRLCNKHKQVLYIEDDTCGYCHSFYPHNEQKFVRDFIKNIKKSKYLSQENKQFILKCIRKHR